MFFYSETLREKTEKLPETTQTQTPKNFESHGLANKANIGLENQLPKLVLAYEQPGLTLDSPCTIELISSLDELRHNQTYKCYEIKEDLFGNE